MKAAVKRWNNNIFTLKGYINFREWRLFFGLPEQKCIKEMKYRKQRKLKSETTFVSLQSPSDHLLVPIKSTSCYRLCLNTFTCGGRCVWTCCCIFIWGAAACFGFWENLRTYRWDFRRSVLNQSCAGETLWKKLLFKRLHVSVKPCECLLVLKWLKSCWIINPESFCWWTWPFKVLMNSFTTWGQTSHQVHHCICKTQSSTVSNKRGVKQTFILNWQTLNQKGFIGLHNFKIYFIYYVNKPKSSSLSLL